MGKGQPMGRSMRVGVELVTPLVKVSRAYRRLS